MSAQHTPGPWIACEYGGYGDYDGKCRVVLGEGGDIRTAVVLGFDTPENEANARLIAAAPDLLEALRYCRNSLKAVIDGEGGIGLHAPEIIEADAAIAKATGQEGGAR